MVNMNARPPGLTLLVVGLLLFFLVRPIVDGIWVIGGLLSSLAFGIGILSIIGGAYILIRSRTGIGR